MWRTIVLFLLLSVAFKKKREVTYYFLQVVFYVDIYENIYPHTKNIYIYILILWKNTRPFLTSSLTQILSAEISLTQRRSGSNIKWQMTQIAFFFTLECNQRLYALVTNSLSLTDESLWLCWIAEWNRPKENPVDN